MPEFGTIDFFTEMASVLNQDPTWLEKGKPLSCSMVYVYESPIDKCFFVRFEEGALTEVKEVTTPDQVSADYVISGSPSSWKGVLQKKVKPTLAFATGKLKVQGKQTFLLKNMGAFTYMLDTMTSLHITYPEGV